MITYRDWLDKNGQLHLTVNPLPSQTENSILFTAELRLLQLELGEDVLTMPPENFAAALEHNKDSHDNKTGRVCFLHYLGIKDNLPIHKLLKGRVWYHPRDLIIYGYNKYPILFFPLLFIPAISCIFSCARTFRKTAHGSLELTTSGKMLAWVRCVGLNMRLTLKICTWLIKRNPHFGSWYRVAQIYFPAEGHPIPQRLKAWENL